MFNFNFNNQIISQFKVRASLKYLIWHFKCFFWVESGTYYEDDLDHF
jgi:hypothetical protein